MNLTNLTIVVCLLSLCFLNACEMVVETLVTKAVVNQIEKSQTQAKARDLEKRKIEEDKIIAKKVAPDDTMGLLMIRKWDYKMFDEAPKTVSLNLGGSKPTKFTFESPKSATIEFQEGGRGIIEMNNILGSGHVSETRKVHKGRNAVTLTNSVLVNLRIGARQPFHWVFDGKTIKLSLTNLKIGGIMPYHGEVEHQWTGSEEVYNALDQYGRKEILITKTLSTVFSNAYNGQPIKQKTISFGVKSQSKTRIELTSLVETEKDLVLTKIPLPSIKK